MRSIEDDFLARLACGLRVEQEEYDQLGGDLPPEELAGAFARRFWTTRETQALVEAARLYLRAGMPYEALEVCSRGPRAAELQRILQKGLAHARRDYPDTPLVGKLLEEAFLVIDLASGKIVRFPPILPATMAR